MKVFLSKQEHDALPEALKGEYVPTSDKEAERGDFRVKLDDMPSGYELTDTSGLLNALSSERSQREAAERKAREASKAYEGVDLEKLRADSAKLGELLEKGGDPGDLDERRKELERSLAAEYDRKAEALTSETREQLAERDQRIEALQAQLDAELLESHFTRAARQKDPEVVVPFLMPVVRDRTRIVEEDGRRRVQVVDEKGNVRYATRDGQPVEAGLDVLVDELHTDPTYGRAFSGGGAGGGSGARPNASGGLPSGENPFDRSSPHFNLTKQAELERNNPREAARLKELAGPMSRRSMLQSEQPSGA